MEPQSGSAGDGTLAASDLALLHRTLTANLPDTSMFLLDRDLRVLIAEGEGVRQLPWVDETMFRGRLVAELQGELPSEVLAMSLDCYQGALDGERGAFEFDSDGFRFVVTAVPIRGEDGRVESALVVVRDITERTNAERRLAQHARQQQCVARLGQSALRERNLKTLIDEVVAAVARTLDLGFCVVRALRPSEETFETAASVGFREGVLEPAEIRNDPSSEPGYVLIRREPVVVADLSVENRFDRDTLLLDHSVVSGMSVVIEGRARPFGVLSAYTSAQRTFDEEDVNFLTAVANVLSASVERHSEEAISRHAARHDPLTGLPNRTVALDRLDHALSRRRRDGTNVAVLMLDLDRFKIINDSLGHRAGDELLVAFAPRLRQILRSSDTVARLSGDEFVIVCEAPSSVHEVTAVAQRVAAVTAQPFGLQSGEHFMTASIGISIATSPYDTPESMLRDADAAMYRVKKRGRGQYEVFDDGMRAEDLARLRIETELRRALNHDQLRVDYQPIIDTVSRRPTGIEALVQWEHPERGLIASADFIPIAEETGLIIALGRSVLTRACEQAAVWQRRFDVPLQVLVKVSARQIADRLFPADVADIVTRSGLRHGTLGLEVTESVLLAGAGSTATVLTQLVDAGVRLILADFGTGYASLTNLTEFPLAGLRIDRSLTNGIGRSPADPAIVKAVIDLCRALGLTVVADGVDSEQQLSQLCLAGCTQAQGHLFSRAQAASATSEYLADLLL